MTMQKIFSRIKLNARQVSGLTVLVLLSAVGEMLLPSLLAWMINNGVADAHNRLILLTAAVMAGITVFACLINICSVRLASRIATDFSAKLRQTVFEKVQSFSTGSERQAS